jgi:hypothetical protein
MTLSAEDGGTSSPWLPNRPGRVLEIACKLCGAIVRWDYFAPAGDGRLGTMLALIRGPVEDWRPEAIESASRESWAEQRAQRRAS